jgi:hypothetical protein
MFCLQFQIIGRPYELGFIRFSNFGWISFGDTPTGTVKVVRTKVFSVASLKLFSAPLGYDEVDWASDIFHAAGTYFVLSIGGDSKTDPIFKTTTRLDRATEGEEEAEADVGTSGFAAYMNAVLRSSAFVASLKADKHIDSDITSYGPRRGAATHLAQFSCMKTVAIAHRGGWALDSTDTVLEYITGTDEEDSKAGLCVCTA